MKKILLVFTLFVSFTNLAQDCSELFISEYVEGWSNNKALEIYNPTSNSIDLSDYMIIRYSNGSTSASSGNAVQLTGSIGAHDVHVGVLEKLDPNGTGQEAPIWDSLQVKADAFYCPEYNTSNAWYFNWNDALVLAKGTVKDLASAQLIDVFYRC